MRLWVAAVTALSIMAPCVGHAGVPMTCQVDVRSDLGGRVQLGKVDPTSWVVWTPPSSARTFEMGIGYVWRADKPIGDVVGAHVTFTPATVADAADYRVRLTDSTGEVWTCEASDLQVRPEQDDVPIVGDDVRGEAIIAAIDRGERVTVEVLREGKVEMTGTFDFSNIQARDALVAKASHLAERNDPRVCKPDQGLPEPR